MLSTPTRYAARLLGLVAGIAVVALIITSARPTANTTSSLPATVSFSVPVSGEFDAVPAAPDRILVSRTLRPEGDPAAASFTVSNQTGEALTFTFEPIAVSRGLDGLLRIRLRAGNATLADTTLQGLRHGSAPVTLPSGGAKTFQLTTWIPPEIGQGYEGQRVDISLVPTIASSAGAGAVS